MTDVSHDVAGGSTGEVYFNCVPVPRYPGTRTDSFFLSVYGYLVRLQFRVFYFSLLQT